MDHLSPTQRFSKSFRISDDTNAVSSDTAYTAILRNDLQLLKEAIKENRVGCLSYLDPITKMTALCLASSLGREEYVTVLLDAGSEIDAKDDEGNSALLLACSNGHKNILNCLVFHNVDVTAVNNKNCNALHVAAYNGHYDIVSTLLNLQKIDIDLKDASGMTALLYASKAGHVTILRYLISFNANVNAISNDQKTLLALAAEGRHYDAFICIIQLVHHSLTGFLCSFKQLSQDFILEFANERKKEFEIRAFFFINSIIEIERLDLAIILLVNDIPLLQPGIRNTDGILIELCSKKYLEVDNLVQNNPKSLFYSSVLLTYCKSPVKILNKLYDEYDNEGSAIGSIIKQMVTYQDKMVILKILTYQKSLINACNSHPLEQEDLNLWIQQIDMLLVEMLKSKALDNIDYMLQLLLPTLSLEEYDSLDDDIMSDIHRLSSLVSDTKKRSDLESRVDDQRQRQDHFIALHRSWSLAHFEKVSVLSYCVSRNLKLLFQCSQISGIIESVFYSTLIPDSTIRTRDWAYVNSMCSFTLKRIMNSSKRKSLFLFIGKLFNYPIVYPSILEDEGSIGGIETTKVVTLLENLRYCPFAMFSFEVLSKIVTISLVTYISLNCYRTDSSVTNDDIIIGTSCNSEPEVYIIIMLISNTVYEIGQLAECSWNLNRYTNTWNILDLVSLLLLSIWAGGYFSQDILLKRVFLPLSAVPLSLTLLQSISIVKSIGQLIIMIRAMIVDLMSMFILYCLCTFGFAVTLGGLAHETSNFSSLQYSFITLLSATLGGFTFFDVSQSDCSQSDSSCNSSSYTYVNEKVIANVSNVLLILYLLGSTVILLNLLIARMANTHNRIDSRSLQEWSYFMGQTLQSFVLIREKSCLCLLPAPFNLLTATLLPFQYILNNRGGIVKTISLAGTVADFLLLGLGALLSIPLVSVYIIFRFSRLIRYLSKSSFPGSHLLIGVISLLFPFYLIYSTLLHILSLAMTLPRSLLRRPFVYTLGNGVIDGFQSSLTSNSIDKKHATRDSHFGNFNPIFMEGVEMSTHNRIEDDINVTRSSSKVQNFENRIFFSDYDIEHIMKPLRVIRKIDTVEKQLEKLTKNFQNLEKRFDEMNEKVNTNLLTLMQSLDEIKKNK